VKSAKRSHGVLPGTDVEMIRVRQHKASADGLQVLWRKRPYCALSAYGHKGGRLDCSMW
jgi:hypothetical protein